MSFGRHFGPPTARTRGAAVLVLLYAEGDQWHLPLTVRPATLEAHAGQISLPGGLIEPGEAGHEAALRELEEELGVPRQRVAVLGALSPLYVYASDFIVAPFVAAAEAKPTWQPSPDEVAEVLEVPLAHLYNPAFQGRHARRERGMELTVPHFLWGRHRIWGATSMILSELIEIVVDLDERDRRDQDPTTDEGRLTTKAQRSTKTDKERKEVE